MRLFLTVLILIFTIQSSVKANDISEFEIEGMSIGDSLLNYFSKNTIENSAQEDQLPNDKYFIRSFWKHESFTQYELVNIYHLKKDKKYIIVGLTGLLTFDNNINECFKEKNNIENQFDIIFDGAKKDTGQVKKSFDKTGNSKGYITEYTLKEGSVVQITCDDWSDTMSNNGYIDSLTVSMQTYALGQFILNDAYN